MFKKTKKSISFATTAAFLAVVVAQPAVVAAETSMIDQNQQQIQIAQQQYQQYQQNQQQIQQGQQQIQSYLSPSGTVIQNRQTIYDQTSGQLITLTQNNLGQIVAYNQQGQQVAIQQDWLKNINFPSVGIGGIAGNTGATNLSATQSQQLAEIASFIKADSNLNAIGKIAKALLALEAIKENNQIIQQQYIAQIAAQKRAVQQETQAQQSQIAQAQQEGSKKAQVQFLQQIKGVTVVPILTPKAPFAGQDGPVTLTIKVFTNKNIQIQQIKIGQQTIANGQAIVLEKSPAMGDKEVIFSIITSGGTVQGKVSYSVAEYSNYLRDSADQTGGEAKLDKNGIGIILANQELYKENQLSVDIVGKIAAINGNALTLEDRDGKQIDVHAPNSGFKDGDYINVQGAVLSGADGNIYIASDPTSGLGVSVNKISQDVFTKKAQAQQQASQQFAKTFPEVAGYSGTGAGGNYYPPTNNPNSGYNTPQSPARVGIMN